MVYPVIINPGNIEEAEASERKWMEILKKHGPVHEKIVKKRSDRGQPKELAHLIEQAWQELVELNGEAGMSDEQRKQRLQSLLQQVIHALDGLCCDHVVAQYPQTPILAEPLLAY